MERTVVTFSPENLITVCLMVFIGFGLFGIIAKMIHKARAGADG